MDNHLYILSIRRLLPCQIAKLSLVKYPLNEITCWECSTPLGNRRHRQQSLIHQKQLHTTFSRTCEWEVKTETAQYANSSSKESTCRSPTLCMPLMWQSPRSTVLHGGVPVLAPQEWIFLVLSKQLWGLHRSGDSCCLVTRPWLRGSVASQCQGKIV